MKLRKFASNGNTRVNKIPVEDREVCKELSLLGLFWSVETDAIKISLGESPSQYLTKRTIEKFVRKHFDPLGLIAPVLLPWKILIQELWRKKCDWDDLIPDERIDKQIWNRALKRWKSDQIVIPRFVPIADSENQVHVFVDAFAEAVVYLTTGCGKNRKSNLIFSKS